MWIIGALSLFWILLAVGFYIYGFLTQVWALLAGVIGSTLLVILYCTAMRKKGADYWVTMRNIIRENFFSVVALYGGLCGAAIATGGAIDEAILKRQTTPEVSFSYEVKRSQTAKGWSELSVIVRFYGSAPPRLTRVLLAPVFYRGDKLDVGSSVERFDPQEQMGFVVRLADPSVDADGKVTEWQFSNLVSEICSREEYRDRCGAGWTLIFVDLSIYGRRGTFWKEEVLGRRPFLVQVRFEQARKKAKQ